jgi:hypothetical protein
MPFLLPIKTARPTLLMVSFPKSNLEETIGKKREVGVQVYGTMNLARTRPGFNAQHRK